MKVNINKMYKNKRKIDDERTQLLSRSPIWSAS